MRYTLHPGAEQDLDDAFAFYLEKAGAVIAGRFVSEFARAAMLLTEHPDLGAPTTRGRRMLSLRVFPYSVVYRSTGTEIQILVVRHHRRKPGYGGARR
jgi:plasmid stabilization system protein ParE